MKLKNEQGVIFIFLNKSFKRRRRKPQAKQRNRNVWVKTWLKHRADFSSYNNLLHVYFLRLKSVKSLQIVHFFSTLVFFAWIFFKLILSKWFFFHKILRTKYLLSSSLLCVIVNLILTIEERELYGAPLEQKLITFLAFVRHQIKVFSCNTNIFRSTQHKFIYSRNYFLSACIPVLYNTKNLVNMNLSFECHIISFVATANIFLTHIIFGAQRNFYIFLLTQHSFLCNMQHFFCATCT